VSAEELLAFADEGEGEREGEEKEENTWVGGEVFQFETSEVEEAISPIKVIPHSPVFSFTVCLSLLPVNRLLASPDDSSLEHFGDTNVNICTL
jgi:hypothetical protein